LAIPVQALIMVKVMKKLEEPAMALPRATGILRTVHRGQHRKTWLGEIHTAHPGYTRSGRG